jgi:hypothetical protein
MIRHEVVLHYLVLSVYNGLFYRRPARLGTEWMVSLLVGEDHQLPVFSRGSCIMIDTKFHQKIRSGILWLEFEQNFVYNK